MRFFESKENLRWHRKSGAIHVFSAQFKAKMPDSGHFDSAG
jgi:hypothetical protein